VQAFAALIEDLDATTGSKRKVALIRAFLTSQPAADGAWALQLLIGQRRRRLITGRRLREILLSCSVMPDWLFAECHGQVGDSAETVALLWPQVQGKLTEPASTCPATVREGIAAIANDPPLHWWMDTLLPSIASLDNAQQSAAMLSLWQHCDPSQHLLINKLLTGGFRIGVARGLVVQAIASGFALEETVVLERLMAPQSPSAAWFTQLTVAATRPRTDRGAIPYPFFLASPLQLEALRDSPATDWWVEHKWDGIRGQLIRRASGVFLWSRGEELINTQFPELVTMAEHLPLNTVLDGEVICWPEQHPQPLQFSALQRRLGRQQVGRRLRLECPAAFVAYDLLEHEGEDLRSRPLHQRREQLQGLDRSAMEEPWRLRWSEADPLQSWNELEELRNRAVAAGAEGVMLKHRDSPYLSGRKRGHWWKHKRDPMALDAVLIYAQAGSGRRANLFTDYTFALWDRTAAEPEQHRLVTFAKAYSGLDNEEILELDRWIRRHTRERFGPARAVEPQQVFEIGFEGIQHSRRHKCGLAVRFPRILRWRRDRTAESADSLGQAMELVNSTTSPSPAD
jgi:DNA ligase-1